MRALFAFIALVTFAPAHAFTVLSYHDVRDTVRGNLDPDRAAISTRHLVEHFEWFRAHGYRVLSLDDVLAARRAGTPLPEKSVLLTFDDGLASAATRVLPLLRAYRYPAVVAVVGHWLELGAGDGVDYGAQRYTSADFLSAQQMRELVDSGLVEIASHSDDLHRAVPANPLGGMTPAATTRIWHDGAYETESAMRARLSDDLARSSRQIERLTGKAPRAIVWPYGAYSRVANQIAAQHGMTVAFDLGGRHAREDDGDVFARVLIDGNPGADRLAWELRHVPTVAPVRAVQVDLDYVYDADPAQVERNLGALIERVRGLGVNQVWLQATADPDGDGAADAAYFPNRHLPLRADLYSRVAWQLRTRAGVEVLAWLPALAFVLPDAAQQARLAIGATHKDGRADPPRLDPFLPETQAIVGDIYEDLAAAGYLQGLLFGDDAVLRDDDRLAAGAPAPGRARTDALIAYTDRLTRRAGTWRPALKTTRNLFAQPVLDADAERWTAQNLERFVASYDAVALMAMPELEHANDADAWLERLARTALAVPGARDRVVFELQSRDWNTQTPIAAERLVARARVLQASGARHLGYYPDDFLHDAPALAAMRRAISASEYPYRKP